MTPLVKVRWSQYAWICHWNNLLSDWTCYTVTCSISMLLCWYYKVTTGKQRLQNTTNNELPYFHIITDREKKMTIIRYVCLKKDKIVHRRLSLWYILLFCTGYKWHICCTCNFLYNFCWEKDNNLYTTLFLRYVCFFFCFKCFIKKTPFFGFVR